MHGEQCGVTVAGQARRLHDAHVLEGGESPADFGEQRVVEPPAVAVVNDDASVGARHRREALLQHCRGAGRRAAGDVVGVRGLASECARETQRDDECGEPGGDDSPGVHGGHVAEPPEDSGHRALLRVEMGTTAGRERRSRTA